MTTWLEFRSEPVSVPDVMVITSEFGLTLLCDELSCPFADSAKTRDEADEKAWAHQQWHEDGMPE